MVVCCLINRYLKKQKWISDFELRICILVCMMSVLYVFTLSWLTLWNRLNVIRSCRFYEIFIWIDPQIPDFDGHQVETAREKCSISIISLLSNLFFNYSHKFRFQFWLDQFSLYVFGIKSSWEHFHRVKLSCQLNLSISRTVKCRYRFTRQIIKRSRKLLT